jgi:hypothetical protein
MAFFLGGMEATHAWEKEDRQGEQEGKANKRGGPLSVNGATTAGSERHQLIATHGAASYAGENFRKALEEAAQNHANMKKHPARLYEIRRCEPWAPADLPVLLRDRSAARPVRTHDRRRHNHMAPFPRRRVGLGRQRTCQQEHESQKYGKCFHVGEIRFPRAGAPWEKRLKIR